MMKTPWGKPVHVISFIRTRLVTLSVGVCFATLMGCGNKLADDASPLGDTSPADGIETLRKAVEQGDAEEQTDLGMRYYTGDGVPQDYAEAVKWYRQAAEQGDALPQYFLGRVYAAGAICHRRLFQAR